MTLYSARIVTICSELCLQSYTSLNELRCWICQKGNSRFSFAAGDGRRAWVSGSRGPEAHGHHVRSAGRGFSLRGNQGFPTINDLCILNFPDLRSHWSSRSFPFTLSIQSRADTGAEGASLLTSPVLQVLLSHLLGKTGVFRRTHKHPGLDSNIQGSPK